MATPKGDKLFVNLGPSQARRRLKGFGHGVRKVQSAGSNRAVIIHTATGQHLSELEQQFRDVGFSTVEFELPNAVAAALSEDAADAASGQIGKAESPSPSED